MASSHYKLLGVSPSASIEEIKKNYKKLAIKYHPDKTENKAHHELFLRINEAYTTLVDPKLRQDYNTKNGFSSTSNFARSSQRGAATESTSFRYTTDDYTNPFRQARGSATDTFRNGYHPSYFDFFRQNHMGTSDNERGSRFKAQSTFTEDESVLAAKLAQRKMKEAMDRRRQEFVEKVQREQKQQEEWAYKSAQKSTYQNGHSSNSAYMAASAAAEGVSDQYRRAKFQAHQSAWAGNAYDNPTAGHPAEPIVVEDEDEENESSGQSPSSESSESEDSEDSEESIEEFSSAEAFKDQQTEPPLNDNNDETSFGSANTTANTGQYHPEVVEIPEEGEETLHFFSEPLNKPLRSPPGSPRRMAREAAPHVKAQISKSLNEQLNKPEKSNNYAVPSSHNSAKKAKFSNFDDMKATLGSDINDVDFSDFRDTLPNAGIRSPRRQPSSSGSFERPSKKAKTSEFSDGSSKAQTLFTPVNAGYTRKAASSISVSDLTPHVDDSKLIFNYRAPHINLDKNTNKDQWFAYVNSINEYQQAFNIYREAVLSFQVDRLKKDVRHHNVIYSDSSCLDVYQMCLFNDALLLQSFNKAMAEFRGIIKEFNSNCAKVNSGDLNFQFSP